MTTHPSYGAYLEPPLKPRTTRTGFLVWEDRCNVPGQSYLERQWKGGHTSNILLNYHAWVSVKQLSIQGKRKTYSVFKVLVRALWRSPELKDSSSMNGRCQWNSLHTFFGLSLVPLRSLPPWIDSIRLYYPCIALDAYLILCRYWNEFVRPWGNTQENRKTDKA